MNTTQLQTTLGPIIGLIAGYFAAWWGIDVGTVTGILTAFAGLVYAIYTAIITRKSAMVSTVANMPEVDNIQLNKHDAGSASLDAATPSNVVTK